VARKVGITETQVRDAAAAIADTDGSDAVTLASVAERLGVRSPSLYAHVDGLPGLRRLLALHAAGAMAAALGDAARGRAADDALRAIAHAYRTFAREHPGWYAALQRAVRPGEDDALYDALAAVVAPAVRALGEAGVPADERVHLTRAYRAALHGFASLERSGGFGMPESVDESFRRLVDLLLAGVAAAARPLSPYLEA
jgi:AcrR family transcriptional regulator